MTDKSAGAESDAHFWRGVVTVLPHAAVERIHVCCFSGENADRQPPADHLAVGRQVRSNAEDRLRAARMRAETSYDFVEDQRCVGLFGDCAQLAQKFYGLQARMPALHR